MKTLILYHSADFDGTLSRDVCLFFLQRARVQHELTCIGWNYGDPVPDIAPFDLVYMVDISIPQLLVSENFSKIVWIDHHKTAMEAHGEGWLGVRIDGVAACRLCWQWFHHRENPEEIPALEAFRSRLVPEPLLLTLAGEYDIWDKGDPRADTLQFGLRAANCFDAVKYFEKDWVSDRLEGMRELLDLLEVGAVVQDYQRRQNERTAKAAQDLQWEGLRFCCLNASGNSQVFEGAVRPDHEALFLWRYDGLKVRVSLYGAPHRPDVDLGAIAKRYGGGGHRQACGFETTLEWLTAILEGVHIAKDGTMTQRGQVISAGTKPAASVN